MRRALDEFVIEGIKTTIPFHRQLMDDLVILGRLYHRFGYFKMDDLICLHQNAVKRVFWCKW
jgi:acetyl/propionyl-CoA carboxylase alpha subunit